MKLLSSFLSFVMFITAPGMGSVAHGMSDLEFSKDLELTSNKVFQSNKVKSINFEKDRFEITVSDGAKVMISEISSGALSGTYNQNDKPTPFTCSYSLNNGQPIDIDCKGENDDETNGPRFIELIMLAFFIFIVIYGPLDDETPGDGDWSGPSTGDLAGP